jgi:hypothetical protein
MNQIKRIFQKARVERRRRRSDESNKTLKRALSRAAVERRRHNDAVSFAINGTGSTVLADTWDPPLA